MLDHSVKKNRESLWGWIAYDWANSAVSAVMVTFVFSVYFSRSVVGDETAGAVQWNMALGLSGLAVALLSPIAGAAADYAGARKPWIGLLTALCALALAALWFATPGASPGLIVLVLGLVCVMNVTLELALVFYNAMLPRIAPPEKIGRVSGWGWGMGYLGGLACLLVALFGLVGLGDIAPWLGLPRDQEQNIRAVAPLVALWLVVFTLPLLLWTRDQPRSGLPLAVCIGRGLRQLTGTARHIRRHKTLMLYLIASAFYRDGLTTLFAVGGLYAAGVHDMNMQEILLFAIGLNITAGLGAALFSPLDDRLGSKRTIVISLSCLIAVGLAVLAAADKTAFIGLALLLGIFIGPVQSASRTFAARLSPPDMINQTYGLYALTGKTVAFCGPLLYGLATALADSQRAGMASILAFLSLGLILLLFVREK